MSGRIRLAFLSLVMLGAGVFVSGALALAFTDSSFNFPAGVVGKDYYHQVQIREGGGEPPYSYKILNGALPPGLSLNSSTGAVTGQPTAAGQYSFWIEGSDCADMAKCIANGYTQATTQREFSISVDPGLQLTTNSLPQNATIGVPYSVPLQAQIVTNLNPLTGYVPTQPLTWSIISGVGNGLPPGLSLGQDGAITGTPTTEGAYTFRVQVAIDPTRTSVQTFSLNVRQPLVVAASKPLAASPAPTLWEVGVPFSAKLTPSGGNGTYTIALAAGTLPAGLALAPDGTIAGTPRVAGGSQVTIRVTDGEGRTLDYQASFGVAPRLKVATKRLKLAKVGKRYTTRLTATGGLPPKTWRTTSGKLPTGVRLDRRLGVLSGVPRKAGVYLVTFEARDGLKVTATKKLRIVVRPAPKKKHG